MKITYNKQVDALYIKLKDSKVIESEETDDGIVIDYDNDNKVVGVEILFFVKKHKNDVFQAFKEVEKAVWTQKELILA